MDQREEKWDTAKRDRASIIRDLPRQMLAASLRAHPARQYFSRATHTTDSSRSHGGCAIGPIGNDRADRAAGN
jgi:hypothetical protein